MTEAEIKDAMREVWAAKPKGRGTIEVRIRFPTERDALSAYSWLYSGI